MFGSRTVPVVAVVFCLLLAGCGSLIQDGDLFETTETGTESTPPPQTSTPTATTTSTSTSTATLTPSETERPQPTTTQPTATQSPTRTASERTGLPDPPTDVLGWENGYWYNESINVDASDGLGYGEIKPLLNRSMARVEYLRRHEFTRDISVRLPTRDTLRRILERQDRRNAERVRSLNRYYEALFLIGEETDATTVVSRTNANAILGFYIPGSDTIWLITNESGVLLADESLLIHELTHALQDEYDVAVTRASGSNREMAYSSLVEGEANYIEALFEERCDSGVWDCVERNASTQSTLDSLTHPGLAVLSYFPYSDGPAFIHHVYVNGLDGRTGWDAVDRAYVNQPQSSTQIIHPELYPVEDASRRSISISIDPRNGWVPVSNNSYGEAAIFTMFWHQSYERGVDIVNPRSFFRPDGGTYDQFNYTSVPSEGLRADRVVGVTNGTENGYVWVTEWATQQDAREFYDAYRTVIESYDAERIGDHMWMISDGTFEDAYYVQIDGTTVTIVNGPDVDTLDDIYPTRTIQTERSRSFNA